MNPLFWWEKFVNEDVAIGLMIVAIVFMVTVAVLLRVHVRHGRELVRRAVLAQLELAASRGLPLMPALTALARDFEQRKRTNGGYILGIVLPPVGVVRVIRWLLNRQRARDAETVTDIASVMREGDLEKALEAAPGVFAAPLPELLGAAERQGVLASALTAVSDLDAAEERFRADARGRLIYPIGVLLFIELVGTFVFFTTRSITEGFDEFTSDRWIAAILAVQPVLMLVTPILFVVLWWAAGALVPGESAIARAFRRLPFFARASRLSRLALLARTLAALLRAGVGLPEALKSASRDTLETAARTAAEGASVGASLAAAGVIPREGLAFLKVADAGAPSETLLALAAWAEQEHRQRVDSLARAVLPVALVALGLFVASLYWPPFLAIDKAHAVSNGRIPW